jgi:putative addiction module component (TIGR02574 family)
MSSLLERIQTETNKLSSQERAYLADRLLSSLEGEEFTDIDSAWIVEAEHRYEEYKEGKRPGINAIEVFKDANNILK